MKQRPRRRAAVVFMALCYVWTWGLMALYVARKIPRGDFLF